MAPNLYLAAKKAVTPTSWFRQSSQQCLPKHFHASEPVPGIYTYQSKLGLVLIARDADRGAPLPQPIPIRKSSVTRKYYLKDDWLARTAHARITDPDGFTGVRLMFRLDDGVSWVACEDANGNTIPGPWPRYLCVDRDHGKFRLMTKGDSPEWCARNTLCKKAKDRMMAHDCLHVEPAREGAGKLPCSLSIATTSTTVTSRNTPGSSVASSPVSLGAPSPITPQSAPLPLQGVVVQDSFFSTTELDARLAELKMSEESRRKAE